MTSSPQTDQPAIYYSLKDTATALGVGYMAVWRRLRRGNFAGVKRTEDGRWLIPLEAVAKVKAGMKRRASKKEV